LRKEDKISKFEKDAKLIFYAGLEAVEPYKAVKRFVKRKDGILKIADRAYNLKKIKRVFIIGIGKAAFPMTKAIEEVLEDRVSEGYIVVKYGYGGKLDKIKVLEASHPIPDEAGMMAAEKIISLLKKTKENDLVICLISGGGSAILPAPVEGITLEEKQKVTKLLLDCGASIKEINTIRKHLSRLKGGQLAKLAYPSYLHTLILSDVVGDRLDTIASGPTVPDYTTFKDCWDIVKKYHLEPHIPPSVVNHFKRGLEGKVKETPKPGDLAFCKVENLIVGSNILALRAAKQKAESLGYNTFILSSSIEGETREVAKVHIAIAKEILSSGNPVSPPACVLSGGETTVKVKGKGKGGRNQEFCLAACTELENMEDVFILSAGTDGTDGPTDAAGAFCSFETLSKAKKEGIIPEKFLDNNDSYNFFKKIGGLFITGPTNTNVMDLRILLVGRR